MDHGTPRRRQVATVFRLVTTEKRTSSPPTSARAVSKGTVEDGLGMTTSCARTRCVSTRHHGPVWRLALHERPGRIHELQPAIVCRCQLRRCKSLLDTVSWTSLAALRSDEPKPSTRAEAGAREPGGTDG